MVQVLDWACRIHVPLLVKNDTDGSGHGTGHSTMALWQYLGALNTTLVPHCTTLYHSLGAYHFGALARGQPEPPPVATTASPSHSLFALTSLGVFVFVCTHKYKYMYVFVFILVEWLTLLPPISLNLALTHQVYAWMTTRRQACFPLSGCQH